MVTSDPTVQNNVLLRIGDQVPGKNLEPEAGFSRSSDQVQFSYDYLSIKWKKYIICESSKIVLLPRHVIRIQIMRNEGLTD